MKASPEHLLWGTPANPDWTLEDVPKLHQPHSFEIPLTSRETNATDLIYVKSNAQYIYIYTHIYTYIHMYIYILKSLRLSPPTQRRRKHESLNAKP